MADDRPDEQALLSTDLTVYDPALFTQMLGVVPPLLQTKEVPGPAASFTESPWQNVVEPVAVMVGVVGNGFTVTSVPAEAVEKQPWAFETRTVYVPDVLTLMLWVAAPLLQL